MLAVRSWAALRCPNPSASVRGRRARACLAEGKRVARALTTGTCPSYVTLEEGRLC